MVDTRSLVIALALCASPACRESAEVAPSAVDRTASEDRPAHRQDESLPATAKPHIAEAMRAGLTAPRHAADGGGRVTWVREPGEPASARCGERRRFRFRFEVGPVGIESGGTITLQVPPFWGWSTPQTISPLQPGYTTVAGPTDAALRASTLDQQLLGIEVTGRALAPGEVVEIVYGDAQGPARIDRYAEAEARFEFGVDGDGDGVRALLEEAPSIEVLPGIAAQVTATLTSTARPGEPVTLTVAVLDGIGNANPEFAGRVELEVEPPGLVVPSRVEFSAGETTSRTLALEAPDQPGTYRVHARAFDSDASEPFHVRRSNPLRVSSAPRLVWVDLHGHSALSDGTATPEQFYAYARDVAGLDAVALTDHDAWGLRPLQDHEQLWRRIESAARAAEVPGDFLALVGYEWTSWIHGHRHVVYFDGPQEILSSLDEATDTPAELEQALAGRAALIVPHHPAGGPIAVDWSFVPDPTLTPVVEICSVHGSSDWAGDPQRIYSAVEGTFVRDALARGQRLGLIGSGDSHDGHPGLPQLAAPCGGLAAVQVDELSREALLGALRARRVYATSGERIVLRANLAGRPMGSVIPAAELAQGGSLLFEVVGTGSLAQLELVGPDGVLAAVELDGEEEFRGAFEVPPLEPDEWFFVRVEQADRTQAWSSPFWVEG